MAVELLRLTRRQGEIKLSMRVTNQEDGNVVTIKLEGIISLAMAPELLRSWKQLVPKLQGRKLSIDLREVRHLSAAGCQVLAEMHKSTGANVLADTPLTKYFAEEARQDIQSNEKQGSRRR